MKKSSKATKTQTQTTTNTQVGVALLGLAAVSAAAGFLIASTGQAALIVRLSNTVTSHSIVTGTQAEAVTGFSMTARNTDVYIKRLTFFAMGDTDGTFSTIQNNISAGQHVSVCSLHNSQGTLQGQGQIVDNLGNITITNLNIRLKRNVNSPLKLVCSFTDTAVDGGNPDIYAFGLKNDASVEALDSRNVALPGNRKEINGAADPGVNTGGQVAITVTDAPPTPSITAAGLLPVIQATKPSFSLSPSSPSGSSVVGRGEVIRFNITASANAEAVINNLMFRINTTDNGDSDWNQCDLDNAMGKTTVEDFDLYNYTLDGISNSIDAGSSWTLYKGNGAPCDTAPSDVGYAKIFLGTPEVIPAGATYTYALYFDATGASSSQDDSIRFDLPAEPILSTFQPGGVIQDSRLGAADSLITMLQSNSVSVGDVICFAGANNVCEPGEEKGFVTATSGRDISVIRGYLATSVSQLVNGQTVLSLPGSLLWRAGGSYWGGYLVGGLTVHGGTLVY